MEIVRRGYVQRDEIEFGSTWAQKMKTAAEELYYLLNRGYEIKSASTFVGNHYLLSERQRLALVRCITSEKAQKERKNKELLEASPIKNVWIDGFNTIITLEVALSSSLLIQGMDGTIRDLAGLRGTYRIVDKTYLAVELLLKGLDRLGIEQAIIYLDEPVSNSGRLKSLIYEMAKENDKNKIQAELLKDVDRTLYHRENVITTDAIILDHCKSWYNFNKWIIENEIQDAWIYSIQPDNG